MSKLQRWRAPTYTITLPMAEGVDERDPDVIADHKLILRGFSLNDITELVSKHQTELAALFGVFMADGALKVDIGDVKEIGTELLKASPAVAGDIIAFAAGEPEGGEAAQQLPFPIQIEALENIGKLTFDAQGGPKKVIEVVTRILRGVTGLLNEVGSTKIKSL